MTVVSEQREVATESTEKVRIERFPITVIVLTYNEEKNIGGCLEHLEWADDVVLLDSGSQDDTVSEAKRARKSIRVFENPFEDFGQQRNWALDHTAPKHEWILFLDADEHCNEKCAEDIRRAVKDSGGHVGFFLTCRNIFLGKWIKRCTLYPTWQLRLLKMGEVRYRKEGHGQREVTNGSLGYVKEPYDHYGFSKGISDWVARHNYYSTAELELILRLRREPLKLLDLFKFDALKRRRCLKRLAAKVGFRPVFRFFYTYFLRRGFMDGYAGLLFCLLRVSHEIHITAKLVEAELAGQEKMVDVDQLSTPTDVVSDR